MKRASLLSLLLLAFAAASAQATVTINLTGGVLYGTNTSSPLPPGTLIQLVLSRNPNGFDAPTAGSFTGNSADDIVLFSFSIDNSQGFSGSYGSPPITFSLAAQSDPQPRIDSGDLLLLRWFPGLTTSSTAPAEGQRYGEFRTDLVQDLSDINWTVPGDGANVFLNFYTQSQGGANAEAEGVSDMTVIPEPSTYALLLVGLVGAVFARRHLKLA